METPPTCKDVKVLSCSRSHIKARGRARADETGKGRLEYSVIHGLSHRHENRKEGLEEKAESHMTVI